MPTLTKKQDKAIRLIETLQSMYPDARIILNYGSPWELLVAVALSAQCTDKQVNKVTAKLFKKYPKLEDYVNADLEEFEKDIYSTGFYRNKAKNILAAAKKVTEEFGGQVPRTMAEIITIPGVARKTGNVVLSNAYGVVEGIAVDTHVIRFANLFGLTKSKDPIRIEKDLMKLFPKELWNKVTYLIISYGRDYPRVRTKKDRDHPLGGFMV